MATPKGILLPHGDPQGNVVSQFSGELLMFTPVGREGRQNRVGVFVIDGDIINPLTGR